jgi:hypothetical protein
MLRTSIVQDKPHDPNYTSLLELAFATPGLPVDGLGKMETRSKLELGKIECRPMKFIILVNGLFLQTDTMMHKAMWIESNGARVSNHPSWLRKFSVSLSLATPAVRANPGATG